MLVAKRDPFHPGANDVSFSDAPLGASSGGRVTRLARTMSILQMVGTLLAVPLGLGSAYSMYRANFSTETTCQSLRSNIVSMLDKSVDASTRHMLVRRDVVAFEQNCGAVDPDATAAFKALLAADRKAAPPASAWVQPAETKPKEVARKAEPRAEAKTEAKTEAKGEAKVEAKAEAKAEAKPETKAETKVAARDPAVSDAAWLAAVRGALTAHVAERAEPDYVNDPVPAKPALAAVPPIAQPLDRGTHEAVQVPVSMPPAAPPPPMAATLRPTLPAAAEHRPVATLAAPAPIAPPVSAPALAPPTSLVAAPVPQPVASAPAPDADHPVPPAFVPVIAPLPGEATAAMPRHRLGERLGALIAHVPLLGPMIEQK
jgi:hypothetical protein